MRSIHGCIRPMKVYRQRTKSEVDILSWCNIIIVQNNLKRLQLFIIISYYLKAAICKFMALFIVFRGNVIIKFIIFIK